RGLGRARCRDSARRRARGLAGPLVGRGAVHRAGGTTSPLQLWFEPHGMFRATVRPEAHGATSVQVCRLPIALESPSPCSGIVVCNQLSTSAAHMHIYLLI